MASIAFGRQIPDHTLVKFRTSFGKHGGAMKIRHGDSAIDV